MPLKAQRWWLWCDRRVAFRQAATETLQPVMVAVMVTDTVAVKAVRDREG